MTKRGQYKLIEDYFPKENREDLPVNFYLLRGANDKYLKQHSISVCRSSFYNTNEMRTSRMNKPISNIL